MKLTKVEECIGEVENSFAYRFCYMKDENDLKQGESIVTFSDGTKLNEYFVDGKLVTKNHYKIHLVKTRIK